MAAGDARQAVRCSTSPARWARPMLQIMGVFSELERAFILARVRAGMARAKAAGKKIWMLAGQWRHALAH